MAPIQIRAQVLRQVEAFPLPGAMPGFVLMPDFAAQDPGKNEEQREEGWQEADLKRAIGVAQEAGLRSYRVEIGPDGTISIVVGEQAQA